MANDKIQTADNETRSVCWKSAWLWSTDKLEFSCIVQQAQANVLENNIARQWKGPGVSSQSKHVLSSDAVQAQALRSSSGAVQDPITAMLSQEGPETAAHDAVQDPPAAKANPVIQKLCQKNR